MNVLLYRVGRNLNRCYRTAEAFGVDSISLLECNAPLTGNLFAATNRISVKNIRSWPNAGGLLALETFFLVPMWEVDWTQVRTIVLGGETQSLPHTMRAQQRAVIPMQGQISGLTVEAALAIALYEWRRCNAL